MITAKQQEKLSKIAYYSFYLAVIIEVLIVLVDKSALINPIEGRLFQLTFLLFFVKVCLTGYSRREYLVIGLFLGIGAISYFVTGRNEIIRVVMFIAACKEIDMQRCLKMVFYLTLLGCVLIMGLSMFGIGGAMSLTQEYGRGSVETRYTLGMGHPNALQCMVWALTVLGLYLYGGKMKWYGYLSILGINFFFFALTDSKTSLLAAVFSVCYTGICYLSKKDILKRFCGVCGMLITIGSIVLSVIIAGNAYRVYNYDWNIERSAITTLLKKLDIILTGRIRTLTENTRWEGTMQTWKVFSGPENNYYFDMGWIRLFYWYGVIPAGIIILMLVMWMFYCYRKKQYMTLALIVSFSLYTVFEAHAVSVYIARNYLLFLLGAVWTNMLHPE